MRIVQALGGRLNRIDIADQIGDGDVGRGELLTQPGIPVQPLDLDRLAALRHQIDAALADGLIRIVVDLAPLDDRDILVEETGKVSNDARFCLASEPQEHDIVLGKNRVHNGGYDSLLEADDRWKKRFIPAELLDQVVSDFIFDGLDSVAGLPELTDRFR